MTDMETRLQAAYADEHLRVPESSVRPRVRRRRVRLVLATAAVIAAATGVGVWVASSGQPENDPILLAATDAQTRRTLCDERAAAELKAPPPGTVVTFADRGQWAELYLGRDVLVSCLGPYGGFAGDAADEPEVFVEVTRSPYQNPDQPWFVGDEMTSIQRGFRDGQSYRVVAVPAGTEKVEMTAVDGTVVAATIAGDRAVAWLPAASNDGVAGGGRVVAYTPKAVLTLEDGERTSRPR